MPDVTLPYNLTDGTTADAVQVMANLNALLTATNDLDAENLTAAVAGLLGLSQSGSPRRGKSIVPATETTTSTSFTTLATPDRVSGIVLPTDGLILVGYQAAWTADTTSNCAAALFLGSNQVKVASDGGPVAQYASLAAATPGRDHVLSSTDAGLVSQYSPNNTYSGDVTTGQVLGQSTFGGGASLRLRYNGVNSPGNNDAMGGFCPIFAAAGTYDVAVKFQAAAATTLTVKNRKLWVWTMGF